jgi:type IV pilus assembly protein PilM
LTRTISRSLGVDIERAEKMKLSGKNFFGSESSIDFTTLETIAGETSRMIAAYYKNQPGQIESIILSGGTAGLPGIAEYFQKALGTKTIVGNPFGRIQYDKKLQPVIAKIGNQFAISLGVALKGIDGILK